MKHYDKLIFVSNSDTALGPMAEAILANKYLLEELEIVSKGVVVLFPEPINPKAEAVLVRNGLSRKEHMSDQLEADDFNERNLLLAVNDSVCQKVMKQFNVTEKQIVSLNQFVEEEESVADPYGGALADYGRCFDHLNMLISKLAVFINEKELLG